MFTGYFRDHGCNMRYICFLQPEYYKYKIMQNMDFVEFLVKYIDILSQHFDYHLNKNENKSINNLFNTLRLVF